MFSYTPDSLLTLFLGPLGPHPVSAHPRGSGYEHVVISSGYEHDSKFDSGFHHLLCGLGQVI